MKIIERGVSLSKKDTPTDSVGGAYETSLKIAVWNCNGAVRLDASFLEEIIRGREVVFYLDMVVAGYRWVCSSPMSTFHGSTRGQEELQSFSK